MTNYERFKIIFDSSLEKRDTLIPFTCEHCQKEVKMRAIVVSKKELLLCPSCSIKYGKSKHTPERKKEIQEKREKTCMNLWGVKNAGWTKESQDKVKKTYENKYGSLENAYLERSKKIKKSLLKNYGVENPMQTPEALSNARKHMIEKYGSLEEAYKIRTITIQNTFLERYGVITNLVLEENKKKSKKTMIERWGVDHPMKSSEIKRRMFETYGAIGITLIGYSYDGVQFDSSFELAFYVYMKEKNIDFEYHPKDYIEYIGNDKKSHLYLPDFKVNDTLIELKGGLFFNKKGEPYNPFSKKFWWDKYNMLIDNKVLLYKEVDMKPIIKEVLILKGKKFFKDHKIKKEELVQGSS